MVSILNQIIESIFINFFTSNMSNREGAPTQNKTAGKQKGNNNVFDRSQNDSLSQKNKLNLGFYYNQTEDENEESKIQYSQLSFEKSPSSVSFGAKATNSKKPNIGNDRMVDAGQNEQNHGLGSEQQLSEEQFQLDQNDLNQIDMDPLDVDYAMMLMQTVIQNSYESLVQEQRIFQANVLQNETLMRFLVIHYYRCTIEKSIDTEIGHFNRELFFSLIDNLDNIEHFLYNEYPYLSQKYDEQEQLIYYGSMDYQQFQQQFDQLNDSPSIRQIMEELELEEVMYEEFGSKVFGGISSLARLKARNGEGPLDGILAGQDFFANMGRFSNYNNSQSSNANAQMNGNTHMNGNTQINSNKEGQKYNVSIRRQGNENASKSKQIGANQSKNRQQLDLNKNKMQLVNLPSLSSNPNTSGNSNNMFGKREEGKNASNLSYEQFIRKLQKQKEQREQREREDAQALIVAQKKSQFDQILGKQGSSKSQVYLKPFIGQISKSKQGQMKGQEDVSKNGAWQNKNNIWANNNSTGMQNSVSPASSSSFLLNNNANVRLTNSERLQNRGTINKENLGNNSQSSCIQNERSPGINGNAQTFISKSGGMIAASNMSNKVGGNNLNGINGNVKGNASGNVSGNVSGNISGNVSGNDANSSPALGNNANGAKTINSSGINVVFKSNNNTINNSSNAINSASNVNNTSNVNNANNLKNPNINTINSNDGKDLNRCDATSNPLNPNSTLNNNNPSLNSNNPPLNSNTLPNHPQQANLTNPNSKNPLSNPNTPIGYNSTSPNAINSNVMAPSLLLSNNNYNNNNKIPTNTNPFINNSNNPSVLGHNSRIGVNNNLGGLTNNSTIIGPGNYSSLNNNISSLSNRSISPLVGSSNPLMGSSNPLMGSGNPLMGSNNPLMGSSNPLMGSNNPLMGSSNPLMGLNNPFSRSTSPLMVPTNALMGPTNPMIGSNNGFSRPNNSLMGQNNPLMNGNTTAVGSIPSLLNGGNNFNGSNNPYNNYNPSNNNYNNYNNYNAQTFNSSPMESLRNQYPNGSILVGNRSATITNKNPFLSSNTLNSISSINNINYVNNNLNNLNNSLNGHAIQISNYNPNNVNNISSASTTNQVPATGINNILTNGSNNNTSPAVLSNANAQTILSNTPSILPNTKDTSLSNPLKHLQTAQQPNHQSPLPPKSKSATHLDRNSTSKDAKQSLQSKKQLLQQSKEKQMRDDNQQRGKQETSKNVKQSSLKSKYQGKQRQISELKVKDFLKQFIYDQFRMIYANLGTQLALVQRFVLSGEKFQKSATSSKQTHTHNFSNFSRNAFKQLDEDVVGKRIKATSYETVLALRRKLQLLSQNLPIGPQHSLSPTEASSPTEVSSRIFRQYADSDSSNNSISQQISRIELVQQRIDKQLDEIQQGCFQYQLNFITHNNNKDRRVNSSNQESINVLISEDIAESSKAIDKVYEYLLQQDNSQRSCEQIQTKKVFNRIIDASNNAVSWNPSSGSSLTAPKRYHPTRGTSPTDPTFEESNGKNNKRLSTANIDSPNKSLNLQHLHTPKLNSQQQVFEKLKLFYQIISQIESKIDLMTSNL